MPKRNPRRTDKEWLDLIQECRSSGLSDKCWCQEHHIHTSNEYSCAVTPQVRQTGNRLSGLAGTAYASLLT